MRHVADSSGPKAARRYAEARELLLKDAAPKQELLVLREGFTGFQSRYRVSSVPELPRWLSDIARVSLTLQDDPVLVEKFNRFYHD